MFDTVPGPRDRKRAVTLDKIRGAVAFERVSFSYDGRAPAVTDLSFAAEPGEVVALVGATGRANPRPWRCSIASTTHPAASGSTGATFAT